MGGYNRKNHPWGGYGYFLEPHILRHLEGTPRFTSIISTSLSLELSHSKGASFEVLSSGDWEGFTSSPLISLISGGSSSLLSNASSFGKILRPSKFSLKKTECELNVPISECRRALKGINRLVIASSGVIVVKVFPYFFNESKLLEKFRGPRKTKKCSNHGALWPKSTNFQDLVFIPKTDKLLL